MAIMNVAFRAGERKPLVFDKANMYCLLYRFHLTVLFLTLKQLFISYLLFELKPGKEQVADKFLLSFQNAYIEYKEVKAAQGVKIAAKDLEKAIAGIYTFYSLPQCLARQKIISFYTFMWTLILSIKNLLYFEI